MCAQLLAEVGPGPLMLPALLCAVIGYLFGCFNGSVIVSKYILKDDVRTHGSGNAGLTNFYRTFGGPLTAAVILTDALKAVISVYAGGVLFRTMVMDQAHIVILGEYWTAIWCMLGHMYPCMFHFKGGKGILSGGAAVLLIDWRIALTAWVCFLVLVVLTRYVSLGSITAAASFPVTTLIVYQDLVLFAVSIVLAGLLIWKHRGNIQRLLSGTERKFSFHRST